MITCAGLNSAPYESDVFGGSWVAVSMSNSFSASRLLLCFAALIVLSKIHGLGERGRCLCCLIFRRRSGMSIHCFSFQLVSAMCSGKQCKFRSMYLPWADGFSIGVLFGRGGSATWYC